MMVPELRAKRRVSAWEDRVWMRRYVGMICFRWGCLQVVVIVASMARTTVKSVRSMEGPAVDDGDCEALL